ncbi:MAG TPA: hypothetical protein VKA18_15660 [Alphaproteobacteria bacterium]|nr:hypothetical protein [Alphaproteobacteria bacterium]
MLLLDGLVIAASAAACFYCIALRRRIDALVAANSPIAASVASLQNARAEIEKAMGAQREAGLAVEERLQSSIEEGLVLMRRLERLSAPLAAADGPLDHAEAGLEEDTNIAVAADGARRDGLEAVGAESREDDASLPIGQSNSGCEKQPAARRRGARERERSIAEERSEA